MCVRSAPFTASRAWTTRVHEMTRAKQHPTGIATLAASAVILLAARFQVDITGEEAAVLVGLVSGLVSAFSPRNV